MKKKYETPRTEKLEFDYTSTVRASGIVKTPGQDCSVANNDKDAPATPPYGLILPWPYSPFPNKNRTC